MITETQIEDLKAANKKSPVAVDDLIKQWEAERFLNAAKMQGNITFSIRNLRGDEVRQAVGQKIAENYALHKDVWAGDRKAEYVVTHIPSGIRTFYGKKTRCTTAAKEFAASPWIKELDEAMTRHGFEALKHVSPDTVTAYRDLYDHARGS